MIKQNEVFSRRISTHVSDLRRNPSLVIEPDHSLEYFSPLAPVSTPFFQDDLIQEQLLQRSVLRQDTGTQTEEGSFFQQTNPLNSERVVPITLQISILPPTAPQQPITPSPQPAPPQPTANNLLPPGMTTSGVLPLPPLNPAITNPTDSNNCISRSLLCRWWRSNDLMERSYICYGFALCAFVFAIMVLAVVPAVLNKKLTC